MPAKDHYHDTAKRALIKDGWTITREQVLFIIEDRHVWIDMEASKTTENQMILIEVKGFAGASQVDELMDAVGKYVVYRAVINEAGGQDVPLYLTIAEGVYQNILSERIGLSPDSRHTSNYWYLIQLVRRSEHGSTERDANCRAGGLYGQGV